jgi:hypothetical protein
MRRRKMKAEARKEYDLVQEECRKLAKMIAEKIEKEGDKDKKENINWGHVGSLKHTRCLLKEILVFLSDSKSEEEALKAIEAELAKR